MVNYFSGDQLETIKKERLAINFCSQNLRRILEL